MIVRLEAASRLLIRASLAIFTVVVLLLIQSAFWSARVSAWMQAIIVATALLSYFRPQYGLLALAVLAPLGQVGSRTLDSQMRGAEALVLAFLAGALLRGWTLREFRNFPSTRLEIAALVFSFIVAASCVEQLWLLQVQRDFPWPFAQEVFAYASRNYLTASGRFRMIFHAMLLLEGIALLLYTTRFAREPQFGKRLVAVIVAGATGTAVLTVGHIAAEFRALGQADVTFAEFVANRRVSIHVGDLNAAGSFFAMAMFIALGMATIEAAHRWAWIGAGMLLASTMFAARSRTAFVSVLLMFACLASATTIGRRIGPWRAAAITAMVSIGLAVAVWRYFGPEYFGAGAVTAVSVRWLFLGTTWRMLVSDPLFGVGIGQYFLQSYQFATPEMLEYYQRQNAHNNFAQVAGELGIPGFVGFSAVLVLALWRRQQPMLPSTIMPVLLGVGAFILTWLGGHPLLVPEVAYPFWITLGVAAALFATDHPGLTTAGVVGAAALLLALSIPFRVHDKSAGLDFAGIRYGVSPRQTIVSRARFFVPAAERRVELPLRARGASDRAPVEIEVFVDGSASQNMTITNREWQRVRIDLVGHASGRFRQIDLLIKPGAIDDVDVRAPVEVGNWEIIAKPNG